MGSQVLAIGLIVLIAVPLGIALLVYLIVPIFKGVGWLVGQVFRFVTGEVGDALRLVGSVVTSLVFMLFTVGNIIIGRWSAASHFGRAIQAEFRSMGGCLYRIAVGHPARLLCLSAMTEGIERRVPEAIAATPGADRPRGKAGQFEGYTIVGSLPGGGSGGRLYIAEPSAEKLAAFARAGVGEVGQVVIKSFSLREGSSLPQIVRENRALPAAKRLGLILEHDLTEERFHYVMRYVPGESLGLVTQRLHAESGPEGLAPRALRDAVEYSSDLVRTLCHYHDGGLWHKDVKPDNIIVSNGQAHLVDFGLITPLRSSLTLTTHGTEYFRDPEMVRMALRGVKVHEVDGAKFDIYAAGAVIYSVIENSFPAHGGLSQISKRCPEALRWIVRRAMTDYDKRYDSAAAMLADLEAVAGAADPFAVKPAMLPSFRGEMGEAGASVGSTGHEWEAAVPPAAGFAAARSPRPHGFEPRVTPASVGAARRVGSPRVRVTNWLTGQYVLVGGADGAQAARTAEQSPPARPRVAGATAAEQLARARERAKSARARAHERMRQHGSESFRPMNLGVGIAVFAFLALVGVGVMVFGLLGVQRGVTVTSQDEGGQSRSVRIGPNGIHITANVTAPSASGRVAEEIDLRGVGSLVADRMLPTPAEPSRGAALVLRDPAAQQGAVGQAVERSLDGLRTVGYRLHGNVRPEPGRSGEAAQADLEMVAELRKDIGLSPFDSVEARAAILSWLDRHPEMLFVLWLGRSDGAEPTTWLVGRRGVSNDQLKPAAEVFAEGMARAGTLRGGR
ncbi:MAG: serine/threonine protein kinase [Phycisphaerales bacterium]